MNRICGRDCLGLAGLAGHLSVWRLATQRPLQRLLLEHGDVVVWGGESRLFYHGIQR